MKIIILIVGILIGAGVMEYKTCRGVYDFDYGCEVQK